MTSRDVDWKQAVRDLSPGLLAYFRAVFPREIAADLVQETLIRLVTKVRSGRFQTAEGTLRMYAYGIARLVRLEGRRSEGRILHVVDPDTLPAAATDDSDDKVRLRTAIARLKSAEQEVILLLIDRDLTLQEIATLLEVPVGTVKSHVHRAKESLKEMLQASQTSER